eukprot:scaffold143893_cov17-Tisochrysis_lutea.AAC.1
MLSWWKTGAEQPAHTLSPAVKLRGSTMALASAKCLLDCLVCALCAPRFGPDKKHLEALERAYSCDCQGDVQKALRSYDIALQAIEEALLLPVLGNGKLQTNWVFECLFYVHRWWQVDSRAPLWKQISLPAVYPGLGPRADNVSSQKHDLAIWQQSAKA